MRILSTRTRLSRIVIAAAATSLATLAIAASAASQTTSANQPKTKSPQPIKEKLVYAKVTTNKGEIIFELNNEKAPISVKNFLSYTEKGAFDGTIFHRVIPGFMIQGGGFDVEFNKRPAEKPIKNEWRNGLKNKRGSIAMARLGRQADSATSQFFINLKDNGFLDQPNDGAGYAVFGKVVEGMDVVDTIAKVQTTTVASKGMQNVPVPPIVIEKVERLAEYKKPEPVKK